MRKVSTAVYSSENLSGKQSSRASLASLFEAPNKQHEEEKECKENKSGVHDGHLKLVGNIDGTNIHRIMNGLQADKGLTHLDVSGCNLNDDNAELLAFALLRCKNLKSVNFSGNNITQGGYNDMADLIKKFPDKCTVDFSDNQVVVPGRQRAIQQEMDNHLIRDVQSIVGEYLQGDAATTTEEQQAKDAEEASASCCRMM